jgi:hypothetical protein
MVVDNGYEVVSGEESNGMDVETVGRSRAKAFPIFLLGR